jgi:acetyl esterase/lipase
LQQTSGSSSTANPALTFPIAVQSGNLLVATIISAKNALSPPTDSMGNTWQVAISQNGPSGNLALYYTSASQAGSDTVTFHSTSASAYAITEYSGIIVTAPLDQTGSSSGTSSTPSVVTSASTTQAHELVVAVAGDYSRRVNTYSLPGLGGNDTAPTLDVANVASTNGNLNTSFGHPNTTGVITSTWTATTSAKWMALQAPFVVAAPPYTWQPNITYCTSDDGTALQADVYSPLNPTANMPLITVLHGGGWESGDKSSLVETLLLSIPELTARGYVVASLNYRLAPTYKFPAMIEDVKCAVRYFREYASNYGIDPTRIGAIGTSAGGHLVDLLGTADSSAGWDVGQYLDQSSRVEAVVSDFGPSDLAALNSNGTLDSRYLDVFGTTDPTALAPDSPVNYTTSDDSPFLLQHGDQDTSVPWSQSQELNDDLTAVGVASTFQLVTNAEHGFRPSPVGAQITPSPSDLTTQVVNFFDSELKYNANPQPQ